MITDSQNFKWYKGNLHTHTTNSDGEKSPKEVTELYKNAGYDFLALTDHWYLSETVENDDFLLLSGCEYNSMGATVKEGIFHIVGIGMEKELKINNNETFEPQEIINKINNAGGIAHLAHPAWSLNLPQDIIDLKGLYAAEIFNSVSDLPHNCRAYSGNVLDLVYSAGKNLPLIAADDSHFYDGEELLSYVMVKAKSLSKKDIIEALKNGDFYATQGPTINVYKDKNKIIAKTSPAKSIIFYSDSVYAADRVTKGENIEYAEYKLKLTDSFVRVEAIDKNGKTAWSSPIFVK